MARQQFNSPIEAAMMLVIDNAPKAEGPGGSRYAQYHAAEVEAWGQWERCGKQNEQARFWSVTAGLIADEYHNGASEKRDAGDLEPVGA
jgi:hypothetical protein